MVEGLLERYGTRAAEVVDVLTDGPVEPLESDPSLTRAEVAYFAQHEQAVHLVDVVLRRTNLAFVGGVTIDLLDELADVLADTLGWDTEERADEVQRTLDVLREAHGVIVPLHTPAQPAESAPRRTGGAVPAGTAPPVRRVVPHPSTAHVTSHWRPDETPRSR